MSSLQNIERCNGVRFITYLCTVFIYPGRLAVIHPGIIEHKPHIITILSTHK